MNKLTIKVVRESLKPLYYISRWLYWQNQHLGFFFQLKKEAAERCWKKNKHNLIKFSYTDAELNALINEDRPYMWDINDDEIFTIL